MSVIGFCMIVFWILCGVLTGGALNAYWRGRFPDLVYKDARKDLVFSLGLGLFAGPIGLLMMPFLTGFFEHGWTLSASREP